MDNLLAYSTVVLVLAMLPGADMMIIMKNTLNYNSNAGRVTILGIILGHLFWTFIAVIGLAVVIANSILLFSTIKYIGAAYLVYIGIKSFTAGQLVSMNKLKDGGGRVKGHMKASFRQGLISNIFNPKVLLLYITIMPQFMTVGGSIGENQQLIILAGILIGISTVWFLVVVELVNIMKRWLKSRTFQNWLSKGAGVVLILFGIRTALEA
ncbi:LysE family translocator [Salinicoccus roseus]|uniref:LysE family transporter n=1 Tax=Salinicoccus roseus TaxID=45670 RepID=A0A0C2E5D2_9STAP|nr:LysE family transporter [Salinicoccus roseus]KIH70552.1 membrane protein [Salinicoccus roseus]MDB0580645.1 LysE family transporter [Salinicoccus roseus]